MTKLSNLLSLFSVNVSCSCLHSSALKDAYVGEWFITFHVTLNVFNIRSDLKSLNCLRKLATHNGTRVCPHRVSPLFFVFILVESLVFFHPSTPRASVCSLSLTVFHSQSLLRLLVLYSSFWMQLFLCAYTRIYLIDDRIIYNQVVFMNLNPRKQENFTYTSQWRACLQIRLLSSSRLPSRPQWS